MLGGSPRGAGAGRGAGRYRHAFGLAVRLQGALPLHEGGVVEVDGRRLPLPLLGQRPDGWAQGRPLPLGGLGGGAPRDTVRHRVHRTRSRGLCEHEAPAATAAAKASLDLPEGPPRADAEQSSVPSYRGATPVRTSPSIRTPRGLGGSGSSVLHVLDLREPRAQRTVAGSAATILVWAHVQKPWGLGGHTQGGDRRTLKGSSVWTRGAPLPTCQVCADTRKPDGWGAGAETHQAMSVRRDLSRP